MQRVDGVITPAVRGAAITPHDTNEIEVTRGIYVGGAGNLTVKFKDDSSTVVITGVLAGQVYPFRVLLVHTDTTATNLVALY